MNITKISELEKTILPWLGRTMKAMDYFVIDSFEVKGLKLTKAQMIVLKILSKQDGMVQNKLAFVTNRDKTSLTRLIDTLEKKKLVRRSVSKDDKRIKLVFITEEGFQMLEEALPVLIDIIKTIQEDITDDDLATTIRVLQQISNNINADELTTPLNHK